MSAIKEIRDVIDQLRDEMLDINYRHRVQVCTRAAELLEEMIEERRRAGALMHDLDAAANCDVCRYASEWDTGTCSRYMEQIDQGDTGDCSCYEWRGVCEDNTKEQE